MLGIWLYLGRRRCVSKRLVGWAPLENGHFLVPMHEGTGEANETQEYFVSLNL